MTDLKDGERIDDLQRCGYKIIQNSEKFCFGMDAVLLSAFAKVKAEEKVVDLGCGNGILPILLEAKTDGELFTGIEVQKEIADMARRSVELNHLEGKIQIINDDIKNIRKVLEPESVNVVVSNPPYMIDDHGIKNPTSPKAIARHEVLCDFSDVASAAKYLLKNGGRFYLVHRPFRLVELLKTLSEYGLEPKRMKLVYPYIDQEPNMVLIEALKGGKSRISIEKPLIVYESKGKYTQEIYDIYGY